MRWCCVEARGYNSLGGVRGRSRGRRGGGDYSLEAAPPAPLDFVESFTYVT
jgi:hypothetical protein